MELLHTIHYTMSRGQNPSCIIADQYKRNVGQKDVFPLSVASDRDDYHSSWWACFFGVVFRGEGLQCGWLALGWVGWVGKGVSVSCMGVQLLCKGVQLCNPS